MLTMKRPRSFATRHSAKMCRCFVLFIFIFAANFSVAQDVDNEAQIDSLVMRLSRLDASAEKAKTLLAIAEIYSNSDCDKAMQYAQLSLSLAKKIRSKSDILEASYRVGQIHVTCQVNVAAALPYFISALNIAIELGDEISEMRIMRSFAYANNAIGELEKSLDYNTRALELAKKNKMREEVLSIYGYLADVYLKMGEKEKAIEYYQRILQSASEEEFRTTTPQNLLIIAQYYSLTEAFEEAQIYCELAIEKLKQEKNDRWLAYAYSSLAEIQLANGQLIAAINNGFKGVKIAEQGELNKERLDNYKILHEAFAAQEEYEESTIYLKKYYRLKDSLYLAEQNAERLKFEAQFQKITEQRENEKTKNELETRRLESENERLYRRFAVTALVAVILVLVFIYFRLRKTSKLNRQLETQKTELEKLSIVAANVEQMITIVDAEDRIEWVNKAFEKKFGYLRFEVIHNKPSQLLFGEKTEVKTLEIINKKVFEEKVPYEAVLTEYTKEGNYFTNQLSFTPILDEAGNLERYVIISKDITEKQKIAEQLEELSLVASNTNNGIVIFDADKKVTWVNAGFERITGLPMDTLIGKTPNSLYKLNATTGSVAELEALLAKFDRQEEFTFETQVHNFREERQKWISTTIDPVFNEEGELIKYVSVSTDITEVKELQGQYSSLVEESSDIIYEVDNNGMFLFANDVASKRTGYDLEEIKRLNYIQLVREDYREEVGQFYLNQIKNMEQSSYLEFPVQPKNGDVFWVGQVAQLKLNEAKDWVVGFSVITRDITEKRAAQLELEKTYNNAQLLSEIGMQITSSLSVLDVIGAVYENINKIMDANIFGIAIPNKEGDRLIFPEIIESGEHISNTGFSLTDIKRLGVICFKENKEIIIQDYFNDVLDYLPTATDIAPAIAGELPNSLIYLPLTLRGKTIGVITVQSFEKNAYDEYQVNLVRSLASFVAIATENATLYQTMEEKISKRTAEVLTQKEELEDNYFNTRIVSEIGQLVSSTLDLDSVFVKMTEKVKQLMSVDVFAIILYDAENEKLNYKYAIEENKRYKPFSVPMSEKNNYAVWCVENQRQILIGDNSVEFKNYVKEINTPEGKTAKSLIYYPMIVEQKMVGAITIQSFDPFAYKPYHLDILKTIASYTGTAINNAALYDSLEIKVKERTEELEEKNNDITASINYAKRLQRGILPSQSFIKQLMPNSFVFNKPKDIVSGDFYWIDRTSSKILFAVVDCTGHGVPGAMMSIIGRNLLDQAVNEKGITIPSQILNFLQVGLSVAFGQTEEGKADLFDGIEPCPLLDRFENKYFTICRGKQFSVFNSRR